MNNHKLLIPLIFALSFFIFSCNREQPPKKAAIEKKMACYRAVSAGDTAWLSIDTAQKVIAGTLTVNYTAKMEIFDGKFTGRMYADTLKGYFDFKINKGKEPFRNPVAFLRRDNKLTMGIGKFMMVMGSAHFDDKVPIDYESSRFVFEEGECQASVR